MVVRGQSGTEKPQRRRTCRVARLCTPSDVRVGRHVGEKGIEEGTARTAPSARWGAPPFYESRRARIGHNTPNFGGISLSTQKDIKGKYMKRNGPPKFLGGTACQKKAFITVETATGRATHRARKRFKKDRSTEVTQPRENQTEHVHDGRELLAE